MAEDNNTDKTRQEFQSMAEETAAVFGNTLRSIASEIAKELRENTDTLDDLGKSLLRNFKNDLNSLARSASSVLDVQQGLLDGSIKQKDILKARQAIDLKLNKIQQSRNELIQENGRLSKKQEEDYKRAVAAAEEQKNVLIKQEEIFIKINNQLGLAGSAFKVIGTALKSVGLNDPFQDIVSKTAAARTQLQLNNEELSSLISKGKKLSKAEKERIDQLEKQNKTLKTQSNLGIQIKEGFKEIFNSQNLIAIAGASILKSLLAINKAQTDYRRNIGSSVEAVDTLNTSLITSVDYIQQANSLVEQFGFNAGVAFSNINIQEAAELTQLIGLSAEEANNLAMFSQANGESLKENAAQAYKNISPLLSQRKVLQEIANVAPSIAMSFGGSAEALAEAASNARLLGLNLSQVDKIAEGLLDIEQSLTSEFEAEAILGKELNLERARFFALTNDIDGVTKEIAANQEVLNSFATGTRIEQQAIADAIGLSRDDISKMIFDQQILNGLSEEEAARKSGMSIEDAKRLTIQESINKSIAKMSEALALPLEMLASLVDNAGVLYSIMGAIGIITTASFAKSLGKAVIEFAAMIPKATTLLGIEVGIAAAKLAQMSAMTLGLGTVGVLVATALGVAGISALVKNAQSVNDGIAPADKGPFTITDNYGNTAITARGDSLAVSPNIRREERNPPTAASVAIDYDKLADAIAMGAERGTSKANLNVNLDGNRVSNALQTPQAMNTRRYSV